jgi:hypothetical protein
LARAKKRSLVISARVPFATFHSNLSSGLNSQVRSHKGFESVTSTKKVSCSVFALLVCEPVTFTTKASCNTFAMLVFVLVALTNKSNLDSKNFKKINRSSTHACLVLFSSFGAIGTELKCGVHPHQILATSSSKRELWHNKNQSKLEAKHPLNPQSMGYNTIKNQRKLEVKHPLNPIQTRCTALFKWR